MHDYIQDRYERRKRTKNFRVRFAIFGILAVVGVGGILYVLHSDWYVVRTIRVEGDGFEEPILSDVQRLAHDYIAQRSWFASLFFNRSSVLGFNVRNLASYIGDQYPLIADISVSKNYFTRTITIKGRLREKFALWCDFDDQCRWFDKDGIVFVDGFLSQGQLINKIISPDSDMIVLGSHIPIDDERVVNDTFSFLEQVGSPGKQLVWDSRHEELVAPHTSGYPQILFSIRQNPLYALEEFKKILHVEKLSYVDLRITNRIFYK